MKNLYFIQRNGKDWSHQNYVYMVYDKHLIGHHSLLTSFRLTLIRE